MSSVIEKAVKQVDVLSEAGDAIVQKLVRGETVTADEKRVLDRCGFNDRTIQAEVGRWRSIAAAQRESGFNGQLEKVEAELAETVDRATDRAAAIDAELEKLKAKLKALETEKTELSKSVVSLQTRRTQMFTARQRLRDAVPQAMKDQAKQERLELFESIGRQLDALTKRIPKLEEFARNYQRGLWADGYIGSLPDGHPAKPKRFDRKLPDDPMFTYDGNAWDRHCEEQLQALADAKAEQTKLQVERDSREKEISARLEIYFLQT